MGSSATGGPDVEEASLVDDTEMSVKALVLSGEVVAPASSVAVEGGFGVGLTATTLTPDTPLVTLQIVSEPMPLGRSFVGKLEAEVVAIVRGLIAGALQVEQSQCVPYVGSSQIGRSAVALGSVRWTSAACPSLLLPCSSSFRLPPVCVSFTMRNHPV